MLSIESEFLTMPNESFQNRIINFITHYHLFVQLSISFTIYFLYSHCLCEPYLKGSCDNIDRATVKVGVALSSLVNGLQGPLSGKTGYGDF